MKYLKIALVIAGLTALGYIVGDAYESGYKQGVLETREKIRREVAEEWRRASRKPVRHGAR